MYWVITIYQALGSVFNMHYLEFHNCIWHGSYWISPFYIWGSTFSEKLLFLFLLTIFYYENFQELRKIQNNLTITFLSSLRMKWMLTFCHSCWKKLNNLRTREILFISLSNLTPILPFPEKMLYEVGEIRVYSACTQKQYAV